MHELSLTESMLKIVLDEAEKAGAQKVTVLRLKLGEMTHAEPASLEFYLEILAKGTIAEGVRLEVDRVPLRAICDDCGAEFAVGDYRFACPACGSGANRIVSGRELYIESIEVE